MHLGVDAAALIRETCDQWNRAERAIKVCEQILGEDPYPSIKELRYSGRRLVEAFQALEANESEARVVSLLQDAYYDCLRAKHDAIDVAVNEIAGRLRLAEMHLSTNAVVEAFPDFPHLVHKLSGFERLIAESREKRSLRDDLYDKIQSDFDGVVGLYRDFIAFRF